MKKITLLSLISVLSCNTFVHAGAMGDNQTMCSSAFVSLEGGYTWNTLGGYDFTVVGLNSNLTSSSNTTHNTGRLAAGMITMMDDQFGVTGELGWGYYGKTTFTPSATGVLAPLPGTLSISQTLSGFDALIGLAFVQQYYSLSIKAGALIQNMQTKSDANFAPFGFPVVDTLTVKTNTTAVLPEIKLGAAYNFNENWALTGAYIFALGTSPKTTGTFNVNTLRASLSVNNQNPTINSLLLGIQYTV